MRSLRKHWWSLTNTTKAHMSAKSSERQSLSRKKRALFASIVVIGIYPLAELLAMLGLYLTAPAHYGNGLENLARGAAAKGNSEAIHPYLGWVHNPQVTQPVSLFGKSIPVNSLGFKDPNESIHQRSPDRFIVGILGGSVAWQTSVAGSEIIKAQLKSHPAIQGREIIIVRLATPGYKQPQQVMALNYIQVMGGEFDAIINIDGYNEVALALIENAYSEISIAYPRAWSARTISALNPASYATAAKLLQLRGSRQQSAQSLLHSKFRWSPLRNLIWLAIDQSRRAEITELGMEVSRNQKHSFLNHGPPATDPSDPALKSAVINLWKRSSVQLQHLCHATNTIYLHVLQPNQYVTNSKVLSKHEQETAYDPQQDLGIAIAELYPQLLTEVDWLKSFGVEFSDQTMLFQNETDTIYSDPFCHYNQRGNEMLAEAVASELLRLLPTN